jgi:hypothetical protein
MPLHETERFKRQIQSENETSDNQPRPPPHMHFKFNKVRQKGSDEFTAMNIKITVLWDMMLCLLVGRYQHSAKTW